MRAGEPGTRLESSAVASAESPEPFEPSECQVDATLLRPGENVLAIQGLNRSVESSDFILRPVLSGIMRLKPERGRKLLEDFRRIPSGEDGGRKLRYLAGRLLELEAKPEEASECFERLAAIESERPEPILRLIECRRSLGDHVAAAEKLREWLGRSAATRRELWDLWTEISFLDLNRTPEDLLLAIPEAGAGPDADLRWLLERLAAGEPILIHCGGQGFEDSRGVEWGEDRFFTSGHRFREIIGGKRVQDPVPFEGNIGGTEDDALYRSHRWFSSSGGERAHYLIPLPPGTYRVRLHFAEVLFRAAGKRVFDVVLEGRNILKDLDLFHDTGFATAKAQDCGAIEVKDGFLDIGFVPKVSNPLISGIEIERR